MGDLEIAAVGKLRSNNFFGSKNTLGKAFLPVTSHAVAHTRTNGRERDWNLGVTEEVAPMMM